MKKITIALVLVAFGTVSFGQSQPKDVTFDELTTPLSPAFNIIDVEPSSVNKPSSPKAVISDLRGLIENGRLKPGVAIEFSPYWLRSRPNLSFQKYVNANPLQSIIQNSSLSIATGNMIQGVDTLGEKLGIGYRTIIVQGNCSDEAGKWLAMNHLLTELGDQLDVDTNGITVLSSNVKGFDNQQKALATPNPNWLPSEFIKSKIISDLEKVIGNRKVPKKTDKYYQEKSLGNRSIEEVFSEAIEYINEDLKSGYFNEEDKKTTLSEKEGIITAALTRWIGHFQSEEAEIMEAYGQCFSSPSGFSMDIASAAGLRSPNNEFLNFHQAGVWTNMSYRKPSSSFSFTWMLRYLNKQFNDTTSNSFDVGIEIKWEHDINKDKSRKVSIAVEGIGRYQLFDYAGVAPTNEPNAFDYRTAINFRMSVNKYLGFTVDLGKNFDTNRWYQGTLLSTIGIEVGFPTKQKFNAAEVAGYFSQLGQNVNF